MYDKKMCKVSSHMECKRKNENTKNRVCMSSLHQQKTYEKISKFQIALQYILNILLAFSVSLAEWITIYPIAYKTRRYHAAGGELLLAILTFIVFMWMLCQKKYDD